MNYYIECFKKYAEFSGRARRKEYWMFVLFNFLIGLAINLILSLIGLPNIALIVGGLYNLVALLPGLGVLVRRLHDTGRSGWWFLISLIPLVGIVVLLIFACCDSQPGNNAYGPNPKGC